MSFQLSKTRHLKLSLWSLSASMIWLIEIKMETLASAITILTIRVVAFTILKTLKQMSNAVLVNLVLKPPFWQITISNSKEPSVKALWLKLNSSNTQGLGNGFGSSKLNLRITATSSAKNGIPIFYTSTKIQTCFAVNMKCIGQEQLLATSTIKVLSKVQLGKLLKNFKVKTQGWGRRHLGMSNWQWRIGI